MNDELQKARRAIEEWQLGQTSAHYESSGRGAEMISTGKGDYGGASYGAYQLSSKRGTLKEYLDQSRYGQQFDGLAANTPAFNAKWKELARADPGFTQDQHDFIGRSHYGEQMASLKAKGIDLSGRGRAVQDMVWSTSVQFRDLTPRIIDKGLEEKFGQTYKLSELSDKDIVGAVQDYKINHNAALFSKSPSWHAGLLKRAHSEKTNLMTLATQEEILVANGIAISLHSSGHKAAEVRQHHPEPSRANEKSHSVKMGGHGHEARALQERLCRLGYSGASGQPLKVDGDIGHNTKHAIRSFQKAHGLHVDGVVGDKTRNALAVAERTPLISERTHPDHHLFHEAQKGLRHLPAGTFRNETEIDNTAAALATKAKQAGITHIDHVMMNTRGDGAIAVQGNLQEPGRHVVMVDRAQAASQTVAESTAHLVQHGAGHHAAQARMEQMEYRSGAVIGMRP